MLTGFFFTFSLLFCESHEIAKKAEEADWQENEKNEHYIVISGLEDETPGGLDQKDQVENILSNLMGKKICVENVRSASEHLYEVELATRDLAFKIRQTFVNRWHYYVDHRYFNIKNKVRKDNVEYSIPTVWSHYYFCPPLDVIT